MTEEEKKRMKELERENAELKQVAAFWKIYYRTCEENETDPQKKIFYRRLQKGSVLEYQPSGRLKK